MIKSNLGKVECIGGGPRILEIPPSFSRSTRILATGLSHVCAAGESEPLKCWGANIFGQNDVQGDTWVRLVSAGSSYTVVVTHSNLDLQGRNIRGVVGSFEHVEYISNVQSGGSHFCQLYLVEPIFSADGLQSVECQGSNTFGQTSVSVNNNINSLAAGQNHTCVVEDSLFMYCFGINSLYQTSPPQSEKILQVRSKSNLTCVDRSDNSITCWGGTSVNVVFLLRLAQTEVLKFISVGQDHICQVYVDSTDDELFNHLKCKDISDRTRMVDLETPENILDTQVRTMSLGESNSCFVLNRSYRNLKCIGKNRHGLNDVPEDFNSKISFVDTEFHHTCASRLDDIRCWGKCSDGNCDIPRVEGMCASKIFGLGVNQTCILFYLDQNSADGIHTSKIVCFGNNDHSQLNPPELPDQSPSEQIKTMSIGAQHSCLVMTSEQTLCWGANTSGQASVPAAAPNRPQLALHVACGLQHSCSVDAQHRLHCWGRHTRAKQPQPGAQHALLVSAGSNYSCAVLEDLRVECWGDNEQGQTKTQTGLALNTYMVASGYQHSCAILNDGQVACWGRNHKGQIDDMELGAIEYEEVD